MILYDIDKSLRKSKKANKYKAFLGWLSPLLDVIYKLLQQKRAHDLQETYQHRKECWNTVLSRICFQDGLEHSIFAWLFFIAIPSFHQFCLLQSYIMIFPYTTKLLDIELIFLRIRKNWSCPAEHEPWQERGLLYRIFLVTNGIT